MPPWPIAKAYCVIKEPALDVLEYSTVIDSSPQVLFNGHTRQPHIWILAPLQVVLFYALANDHTQVGLARGRILRADRPSVLELKPRLRHGLDEAQVDLLRDLAVVHRLGHQIRQPRVDVASGAPALAVLHDRPEETARKGVCAGAYIGYDVFWREGHPHVVGGINPHAAVETARGGRGGDVLVPVLYRAPRRKVEYHILFDTCRRARFILL
ncbi:unnamed protein product [Clonostachys rosea]|uniref:Uncharacterized protein n=1 Tax=Bionectria ochroleuca TaxID=29856 RepID=A0ABY6UFD6_BIOOC|nr:unnamed protein product [Clonostachys rosea]